MAAFDGVTAPEIKVTIWTKDAQTWVIPTSDVREISTHRGRARDDQKLDVGSCTIVLDNTSGDYDPDNSSSTFWDIVADLSALRAGTKVQVAMTWSSVDYPLFTGFMESLDMDLGLTPTVTLTFTDAIAKFGNQASGGVTKLMFDTEYDGESTDTFLTLLSTDSNVVEWVDLFDWATGCDVLCQVFRDNKPIRDIIDDLCTLEAGRWYIKSNGDFWFEPLISKFDRTLKLHLSDDRSDGTVEYDQIQVQSGALQLCNNAIISVADDSGTASEIHVGYSPSSDGVYGPYRRYMDAPFYSDLQAIQAAAYYARIHAFPTTLVNSTSFLAFGLDSIYPDLLGMELGDYVQVDRTTVDGRSMQYLLVLEGIDHNITPSEWRVTLATSAANNFAAVIAVTE